MTRLATTFALVFVAAHAAAAQEISPYPNAPDIAPPMTHIAKYAPVLQSSLGPAIDPAKGYRVQDLGEGAFMVTEGIYQMMILKTAARRRRHRVKGSRLVATSTRGLTLLAFSWKTPRA